MNTMLTALVSVFIRHPELDDAMAAAAAVEVVLANTPGHLRPLVEARMALFRREQRRLGRMARKDESKRLEEERSMDQSPAGRRFGLPAVFDEDRVFHRGAGDLESNLFEDALAAEADESIDEGEALEAYSCLGDWFNPAEMDEEDHSSMAFSDVFDGEMRDRMAYVARVADHAANSTGKQAGLGHVLHGRKVCKDVAVKAKAFIVRQNQDIEKCRAEYRAAQELVKRTNNPSRFMLEDLSLVLDRIAAKAAEHRRQIRLAEARRSAVFTHYGLKYDPEALGLQRRRETTLVGLSKEGYEVGRALKVGARTAHRLDKQWKAIEVEWKLYQMAGRSA